MKHTIFSFVDLGAGLELGRGIKTGRVCLENIIFSLAPPSVITRLTCAKASSKNGLPIDNKYGNNTKRKEKEGRKEWYT